MYQPQCGTRSFAIIQMDRLITINRLNPSDGYSLITKQPKLSVNHGRVLFHSMVINQKKHAHILIFVRVSIHGEVSKSMDKRGCTPKLISPSVLDQID